MDAPEAKRRLRQEMLRRLAGISPARRALEEEVVAAAVQDAPEWRAAGTVLLYRSLPGEWSTVGLANAAWRAGKRVAMPRVTGAAGGGATGDGSGGAGGLALHQVQAWTDLRPGAFGVHEPAPTLPTVDAATVDLAIVPGLGWTADGRRLGRGGGFYDRLLPRLRLAWGVGFDVQVVASVPTEPHDARVARVWHAAALGV